MIHVGPARRVDLDLLVAPRAQFGLRRDDEIGAYRVALKQRTSGHCAPLYFDLVRVTEIPAQGGRTKLFALKSGSQMDRASLSERRTN